MQIIGYLGENYGIILTALILLSILPYSESLFYLSVLISQIYINGILKILHHDPRPFFVTADIQALMCNKSYGNPSGHSMTFTTTWPLFFYLLFHSKVNGDYAFTNSRTVTYWIVYAILLTFFITVSVLALFGRIYLGVHSLDQVLYGMLMGSCILCHFLFVLKKPLCQYFIKFLDNQCTKREFIIHSLVWLGVSCGMVVIAIIAYFINSASHDDPNSWILAIQVKCDISSGDLHKNSILQRKAFRNILVP